MATLVLGTVGRAVGGRLGGVVGTVLGSALDRRLLGGGKTREGARLSDLAVQSSAYGEPIPRLYGRMRVAGTLVWSQGIRETRTRAGGGKRGPATNSYTYSASFAVVVAARPIVGVGRIWADGKLLREAAGGLIYPAIIRVHSGDDDQAADPLIAAAEGIDRAPAYRGRAYVVFEDLPLADYGNRIPNLTFEVIADAGDDVDLATIVADIVDVADMEPAITGIGPRIHGFAAVSLSARDGLGQLDTVGDVSVSSVAGALTIRFDAAAAVIAIAGGDTGATITATVADATETRGSAAALPDTLTLGFSDPARDYQAGTQRAVRRTPAIRHEARQFGGSLTAPAARQVAEAMLRRAIAGRTTGAITLPWRYAGLAVGDRIAVDGGDPWRVRGKTIVGLVVELDLERVATAASPAAGADPGRVDDPGDRPPGPIEFHVLDLPPLPGDLPTAPRLLVAAAAPGRWAGADIAISLDGGQSYAIAASIARSAIIGIASTVLEPGCTDRWDRRSSIEVDLLDEVMWLESRSEAAVLAGANLALVGNEIIQFADAVAIAPGRFRLSTLLRGRRGTETASAHSVGDRLVMLDAGDLASIDLPLDSVGAKLLVKALRSGDDLAGVAAVEIELGGRALRPPAPVFFGLDRLADGSVDATWIRRSRAGFVWTDGVDAPLAEESEAYRLTAAIDGRVVRETTISSPAWTYAASMIAVDGGGAGSTITLAVAQLGSVGSGESAVRTLTLL